MKKIMLLVMMLLVISGAACASEYVTLNSGCTMPVLGLGTWTLDNSEAEEAVYTAIRSGYRLIDTARYYGNEKGVGRGVRRAIAEGIISREDV
ncbi:MAG: aldo/keto reductase, partial [Synergistaceae bacterium]|nr:aldo/keto reductase [Synergistaceae bacterium]